MMTIGSMLILSAAFSQAAPPVDPKASIEQVRLTLAKWMETEQIISKERQDWAQGKEILQGRIDLVGKEVELLRQRIGQTDADTAKSHTRRDELLAKIEERKALATQLADSASVMEGQLRSLVKWLPDPVRAKLNPLVQRIPEDPANSKVTVAERFQNILGILAEVNKQNGLINLTVELRQLAGGASSEVQVIYIGLAQAYYISPTGEAGIGRPSADGWVWSPAPETAPALLNALEILQGKHTPQFVAVPMTLQ